MQENNYQSIFKLLARLWVQISYRYRLKLYALFMLMVLSSVSEVFAIGAILPFLGVLVAPDKFQISNKTYLAILVVILSILSAALLNLWISKPIEILRNRIKLGKRIF